MYRIDPPAGTHVSLSDVPLGQWYPFFMQWKIPVLTSAVYTILSLYFNAQQSKQAKEKAGLNQKTSLKRAKKSRLTPMNAIVFVHNAVLAVYSAWAFWGVFPAFVNKIATQGWHAAMCDVDGSLWNSVLFKHVYLFYLSKYYELFDTVIILLKGRPASILQIYHHAGVIMVMYLANYYSSAASIFIVWENAGVHTIMYTYYALTVAGINPPGKQYLTSLQIFQFLFGQACILVYFSMSNCQTPSQSTWLWVMSGYLLPLIALFVQFFTKTYTKRTLKKTM
ncbi:hypothetical protein GGH12_000978 [Coemansia sp. RSA 1822]|nr:hypothetical protein LPJ76_003054 [Coemansia sp. RSA 638]KAJ2124190.1 hypothetical protein IW147_001928 [Coemansia sp. RSA 720]KAJ2543067.1 hypothetical protein GGF49_002391 [Coemansia sp. RSA 1853]KAJ2566248.1 hypothetical protein GGH12_000978 [Coemansia sp. RSA 1822]